MRKKMQNSSIFSGFSQRKNFILNTNEMSLSAIFSDEFSAYRARRDWSKILNSDFLLDQKEDFMFAVESAKKGVYSWQLICQFKSSCGRYVFWRLLNDQAPIAREKLTAAICTNSFSLLADDKETKNSSKSKFLSLFG